MKMKKGNFQNTAKIVPRGKFTAANPSIKKELQVSGQSGNCYFIDVLYWKCHTVSLPKQLIL
jgi:hypothetical protein